MILFDVWTGAAAHFIRVTPFTIFRSLQGWSLRFIVACRSGVGRAY